MEWSVTTAQQYAKQDRLEEWLHSYLNAGEWINSGLSDGLKKAKRWWIGPIFVPLENMIRSCGPESEMPYKVTQEHWQQKTQKMALTFDDPTKLPPIILESVEGKLYVRDGNHRVGAAHKKGWRSLGAIIWFNSETDWKTAKLQNENS